MLLLKFLFMHGLLKELSKCTNTVFPVNDMHELQANLDKFLRCKREIIAQSGPSMKYDHYRQSRIFATGVI